MTVEINLLSALRRVRHTAAGEVQDAEQQQKIVEFDAAQIEHGKRFTKAPPLVMVAVTRRKTT